MPPAFPLALLLLGPAGSPTIEWPDSGICPGAQDDLERAIAAYLPAEVTESAQVEAVVRVFDAGPVGLRLELELASRAGAETHELVALDCDRLIDHAALLIASAVDPFVYAWSAPGPSSQANEAAQRHHRAVVVQRPLAPAEPLEPVQSPPIPIDELARFGPLELTELAELAELTEFLGPERSQPPISGALSVNATTFLGLFPQVGGGVELEGALERGALRWHNSLGGWFGGRFRASETDVGGDLWALGLGSALCGVPATRRVRVPLCAVGGGGFISARAVGTVEQRRSIQAWAWAGAEARVLLLVREKLAIGLGIGIHAALVRPAWEVQSPGVRFTVPPAMGVLRLTFEARQLQRRKSARAEISSR